MTKPTTCLAAALLFSTAAGAADFLRTVSGEAPLKSAQDEASCAQAAESGLVPERAELEKQCQQDGGLFNLGLVTTEVHSRSCTAAQTLTCSGTGSADPAQAQAKTTPIAQAKGPGDHVGDPTPMDAEPADGPAKARKGKPARLKNRVTPTDDPDAPKSPKPRARKKLAPDPTSEVREVKADPPLNTLTP